MAWEAARSRKSAEGWGSVSASFGSGSEGPVESGSAWRLWIAPEWRRARFDVGSETVDVVFHGGTWWSNGRGISRTNGGAPNSGHGDGWGADLVRTDDYVDLIDIVDVAEGTWLDRPTLECAVAIRTGTSRLRGPGVHGLTIGDPTEWRLSIDAERGVILRSRSWFEGTLYRTLHATGVTFDDRLGAETFRIDPLPGQDWTRS